MEEIDLRYQNTLNSRQNAADLEANLANQGEDLWGGISRIYFSFWNKLKSFHGAINSRPRNLRTALEKYF